MYRISSIFTSEESMYLGYVRARKDVRLDPMSKLNDLYVRVVDCDTDDEKVVSFRFLLNAMFANKIYMLGEIEDVLIASTFSRQAYFLSQNMEYIGSEWQWDFEENELKLLEHEEVLKYENVLVEGMTGVASFNFDCPDVVNMGSCYISQHPVPSDYLVTGGRSSTVKNALNMANVFDSMLSNPNSIIFMPNLTLGFMRPCYKNQEFVGYCLNKFTYNPKILMELI